MAVYLNEDAIARALKVDIGVIKGILQGNVTKVEREESKVVNIKYQKVAFRQRIVSFFRAKGGIGNTLLALNLAAMISEFTNVLYIDLCATISKGIVDSDALEMAGLDPYFAEPGRSDFKMSATLTYLPYPVTQQDYDIAGEVLEARKNYDVIIIDLPNIQDDRVLNAISVSNTLVITFSGNTSELSRCSSLYGQQLEDKDVLLILNGGLTMDDANARAAAHRFQIDEENCISIPLDNKIELGLVPPKSPVYYRMQDIIRLLYGDQFIKKEEGLLGRLFKR